MINSTKRSLMASVMAASIAVTSVSTTPARAADSGEIGRFLLGAGALLIIGSALSKSDNNRPRVVVEQQLNFQDEPNFADEPEYFQESELADEPDVFEQTEFFIEPDMSDEPEFFQDENFSDEPDMFEQSDVFEDSDVFEEENMFDQSDVFDEPDVFEDGEMMDESEFQSSLPSNCGGVVEHGEGHAGLSRAFGCAAA